MFRTIIKGKIELTIIAVNITPRFNVIIYHVFYCICASYFSFKRFYCIQKMASPVYCSVNEFVIFKMSLLYSRNKNTHILMIQAVIFIQNFIYEIFTNLKINNFKSITVKNIINTKLRN